MNRSGNVVIAQGGGPTAVINASLYGIVRESNRQLSASSKIWGARGGIVGVLRKHGWISDSPVSAYGRVSQFHPALRSALAAKC